MKKVTIDGNTACAHIAYSMNDLAIIYPITPSSSMSELCDSFNADGKKNIFNNKLHVVEMQSEAGVAGALHGALSTGALTTTFTSSQGLLLMIPNMYKIAGELLPTVFYVASRSVATHALNIFCDHSDIYACVKTGFNIISCSSVQEVNDIAIACNLSALKSSTPFICFFDGFRTSHELNTIEQSTLEEIKSIVDFDDILKFKSKAMSNITPFAKGTNQNPDVFFQNRVASLKYYSNIPEIVKNSFKKVETITNRAYDTIEYYGDKNATDIIVCMGSACDTLCLAQQSLKKTGVIKVRLLKPFDEKTFLEKLPKTAKNITILERNLDTNGKDILYSDIVDILYKNKMSLNIYNGVFGLGGKEFTPDMAIACFNNMKTTKKAYFTVGINDDIKNTDIKIEHKFKDDTNFACRIYGYGSDGSVSSAKSIIKILGEKQGTYSQGYFDYDSKKSGSLTISHIRTSDSPVNKPFNSEHVNISMCNNQTFITKYDMTSCIRENGIFLINCKYSSEELNDIMPQRMKQDIKNKNISVYTIDANSIASKYNLNGKINTIMETALFKIHNVLPFKTALNKIKSSITTTYMKKGENIVKSNIEAVEIVKKSIIKIDTTKFTDSDNAKFYKADNPYFNEIISPINNQNGNDIRVSSFNADGRMPTNTSKLEKRGIASKIPEWIPENCIQCGRCSMACPHAAIRAVELDENTKYPSNLKTAKAMQSNNKFRIQISPLDCTGCSVCSEVCPVKNKALKMTDSLEYRQQEKQNYEFISSQKTVSKPIGDNCRTLQFNKPYFEFSGACAGCGETPYIKLVTQLFGDRMLIANATGCSSIYGGTYPTCPYARDDQGFGPSWANSLFEDNAEFGYGIAYSRKIQRENFLEQLKLNINKYSKFVSKKIKEFLTDTNDNRNIKQIVTDLNIYQNTNPIQENEKPILASLDLFLKPSTWIIGGDGWAYDIGFGGLDHVIASGENVNILILDTEVYSNTGGQTSKSTPRGASAKFNLTGKTTMKKDILAMLMQYKDVYCAQVSMGANPDQCAKAFIEAEKYQGPSIILAYSPCINHGYNMKDSQNHCMSSVKSGYNTLFRYNPNSSPAMQIDSTEPTIDYTEYTNTENRFTILSKTNPENKDMLIKNSKQDAINKRQKYEKLAKSK